MGLWREVRCWNHSSETQREREIDREYGHVTNKRHDTVNNVTFRFSQDSTVSISIEQRFSSRGLDMTGSLSSVHHRQLAILTGHLSLALTLIVDVNCCVHSTSRETNVKRKLVFHTEVI
jgi:hypothetical protein